MEIATCSYAAFMPTMGTPIRISLGGPRRPEPTGRERWLYVAELAPAGWYLNAGPDDFTRHYTAQLDLKTDDIETKLGLLADEFGPLVLCCWERQITGPECHRRLFSQWYEARHPGQSVPELDGA